MLAASIGNWTFAPWIIGAAVVIGVVGVLLSDWRDAKKDEQ